METKAVYRYLQSGTLQDGEEIIGQEGVTRAICGRSGYHAKSIRSRISLPKHTLNGPRGSVSLWVLALEDLDSMAHRANFGLHNPYYENYALLSDNQEPADFYNSVFSLCWSNHWYPQLYVKFYKGSLQPDAYFPTLKAVAGVGHFKLRKGKWYQLTVTWDKEKSLIKIYANGILVMHSDTVHQSLAFETAGETLYTGNPSLVLSDIHFYDTPLSDDEIMSAFASAHTVDEAVQAELRHIYCGENMPPFTFQPSEGWSLSCEKSLTKPEDLDYFYVQGKTDAAQITPEGLLIETAQDVLTTAGAGAPDQMACYLWTNQFFEGNLYIEYDFKPLQRDGLSLLMVQASGMQREDFMEDYPLRTNGAMQMVCWEDVRNYHWEYFRNVVDVRNDVASHAMIKNPWLAPMGYSCEDQPLAVDEWHKLQFLQIEDHIICAMDGKIVLDMIDEPFVNKGPVLNCGRIAIRCMIRTKLLVKNFKVYNQPQLG